MKKVLTTLSITLLLSVKLLAFNLPNTPKTLSTYYIAPSQNLSTLLNKLQENGFTILAISRMLEKYDVVTISNQELQNTNSYMATLQINVNAKEIRVQNPSYLGAAYLGENYSYGQFKNTLNALENTLGTLNKSFQKANFATLPEYQFMYGLPQKKDILSVKRRSDILKKALSPDAKKYIAYTLTLPNGSMLVGHKLSAKTNRFLSVLNQEKNVQLLPYEAMIKGNEVTIMNPKYYLALSLPMLSFQEFMQIASVPDMIFRNIKKAYQ